jgi:hypothetical protein
VVWLVLAGEFVTLVVGPVIVNNELELCVTSGPVMVGDDVELRVVLDPVLLAVNVEGNPEMSVERLYIEAH